MNRKRATTFATLAALTIATFAPAVADDFTIDWWTIDGGEEMWTTGSDFELSGTIGQCDTSVVTTGGDFELTDGFWPGVPAYRLGDLDRDGDVDIDDFAIFADCMAGPDVTTPPPGCDPIDFANADLDGDADVDLADFAMFQEAFG